LFCLQVFVRWGSPCFLSFALPYSPPFSFAFPFHTEGWSISAYPPIVYSQYFCLRNLGSFPYLGILRCFSRPNKSLLVASNKHTIVNSFSRLVHTLLARAIYYSLLSSYQLVTLLTETIH
jgi:hypothetical protein